MTGPRKALEEAGAETAIVSLDQANADEFDALLLPGGVANPDQLRGMPKAVQFVKRFVDSGKPIGVICHEPWTLVEAGASWVDQPVVVDRGVVSSRKPDDIPAFSKKMIEEFTEGVHTGQRESATRSRVGTEGDLRP